MKQVLLIHFFFRFSTKVTSIGDSIHHKFLISMSKAEYGGERDILMLRCSIFGVPGALALIQRLNGSFSGCAKVTELIVLLQQLFGELQMRSEMQLTWLKL